MILSPQNHLVLSISIWYNRFLHELSVIKMEQGQMKCLERILSRHGHTRLQKEWDGIPLSPDLKRFWDNKWKNIKNSGHTDLTFKPWSSQSNYQPKNNWHKFVLLYLDYFLSKINGFIQGKLNKFKILGVTFDLHVANLTKIHWQIGSYFFFLIFRVLVVHFRKT